MVPLDDTLDSIAYFEKIASFVQREPVREQDKQFLGMLYGLGIEKGKSFNPDARVKSILERAAKMGHVMVATISYDSRYPNKLRWPGYSRWEDLILFEHTDMVGPNFIALDARAGLYYQAAGAVKTILKPQVGKGSQYAGTFKDREGNWLDGAKNYKLNVPAHVPVKDFWSVMAYDAETRSMIDNKQKVSGLDSYHSLKKNQDGSIDLYFGPKVSAGNESNWVQTIPGKGFFLYFRWYGPLEPYFDKSWKLPDVTLDKE